MHYQHYERRPPQTHRSFLIDAGARHDNYAADVTRTYAGPGSNGANAVFNELLAALDINQRELTEEVQPGLSYLELHERMHKRLGRILVQAGLLSCTAEAAFDSGITRTFLPHGLGHLLGLQTHDVGGHLAGPAGATNPPPAGYETLRLTREIQCDQVFTVEPGVYFIPQLLDALREQQHGKLVKWKVVDALRGYGGIRIEDNVLVTPTGIENFTRDAFASLAGRP